MKYPNNLLTLRNMKGLQQGTVAKAIKMKQPEYSKMERGERRIGDHLEKLTKFFKVDTSAIQSQEIRSAQYKMKYTEDLPLFGMPVQNGEGVQMHRQFVSHTIRPDYLVENLQSYACFIHGSAMSPRYEHGDLVYVDPNRQAKEDDYVVIQVKQGDHITGIFRKLIQITDRQMKFHTLKPIKEEVIKNSEMLCVHVIVGTRTNFY